MLWPGVLGLGSSSSSFRLVWGPGCQTWAGEGFFSVTALRSVAEGRMCLAEILACRMSTLLTTTMSCLMPKLEAVVWQFLLIPASNSLVLEAMMSTP